MYKFFKWPNKTLFEGTRFNTHPITSSCPKTHVGALPPLTNPFSILCEVNDLPSNVFPNQDVMDARTLLEMQHMQELMNEDVIYEVASQLERTITQQS